jgi:formylglycine-generating enzyme required for sulfatase activity
VWVPPTGREGFVMGKDRKGEHKVVLTHGFCMDATEVTVRAYARCVEAGACKEPWKGDPYSTYPAKLDEPVNMVSWTKSHAYCAWAGERLPTEAEWEWAATGPNQTKYPWGDEPEPSCEYVDYTKFGAPKWQAGADVGCGGGGPSPVASHLKGDKVWPGGALHDLAGNVWEWVEDVYDPYAYTRPTAPRGVGGTCDEALAAQDELRRSGKTGFTGSNPIPTECEHVLRGGAFNYAGPGLRSSNRVHHAARFRLVMAGFRCAKDAARRDLTRGAD